MFKFVPVRNIIDHTATTATTIIEKTAALSMACQYWQYPEVLSEPHE